MATSEIKIPYKYTSAKLSRAQVRVVLDFMGIDFKDQGKSAAENKARIELERQNNPKQYMEAIDIVVFHKKPEAVEVRAETFYSEWGTLVNEYFEEGKSELNQEVGKAFDANMVGVLDKVGVISKGLDDKADDMWGLMEQRVSAAIDKATEQYKTIAVKLGTKKAVKIDGLVHESFPKLLQLAELRKNIMLVGPAGCGKSFVAPQIAKALGLDYSEQSCTAGMSETVFSGWLLPIGESGRFHYVSSEFVRLYENGGVFLLDEMDAADPNVMVFINAALAGDHFVLPQRFEKPMVKKHKNFICMAACNTFGTGADTVYHGRNALDGATLDRFRIGITKFDYSPSVEEKLIEPDLLRWGRNLRTSINNHKLKRIMSTRFLIDATDMINAGGWERSDVEEAYFSDWSPEEKRMVM
jgi:MoxR-like ATPase